MKSTTPPPDFVIEVICRRSDEGLHARTVVKHRGRMPRPSEMQAALRDAAQEVGLRARQVGGER